jgi:hypothetical protein
VAYDSLGIYSSQGMVVISNYGTRKCVGARWRTSAWVKADFPIEKLVPIPLHLAISDQFQSFMVKNTADVLANIKSKTAVMMLDQTTVF